VSHNHAVCDIVLRRGSVSFGDLLATSAGTRRTRSRAGAPKNPADQPGPAKSAARTG
jgi:hypothetical protein